MPEGDTIWRHAAQLGPALVGQTLTEARSRWPGVVRGLVGRVVRAVEPVGKHLLIEIDDGTSLRVHLGMKGKWRQVPADAALGVSMGQISLLLGTEAVSARCLRAPTVQRFRTRERAVLPALARLGPDVLGPGFSPANAAERARAQGDEHPTVAEVLLDQGVACGIGNVYKSELLFYARLHPFRAPSEVPVETWCALYERAQSLMRANLGPGPRDTTRLGPGRPRHWVYGRQRRGCLRCGTPIQIRTHGDGLPRLTYWCPRCQPK